MKALFLMIGLLIQGPPAPLRTGVIAGQILQPDGSPVPRQRVMAVEVTTEAASRNQTLASVGQTDASGRYRLEGIPPGRYYVATGVLDAPVYFTGGATQSLATIITVAAGAEVAGTDFTMVRTTFTVKGRVIAETGTQLAGASLSVMGLRESNFRLAPDGSFEMENVPAGTYTVGLGVSALGGRALPPRGGPGGSGAGAGGRALSGVRLSNLPIFPKKIVVEERDLDVELYVLETHALSGTVIVEGGGPPPRFELLFAGRITESVPVESGRFSAKLPPGEYRVSAKGLPAGFTLTSISGIGPGFSRGREARELLVVTLPDAPANLSVKLTANTPSPWVRVSGHVTGAGAAASSLSVVLFESDPSLQNMIRGMWRAPVDASGNFELSRVLPGRYVATLKATPDVRLDVTTTAAFILNVPEGANGATSIAGIEFSVPAQKEFRGRIQVDGRAPIPNFTVWQMSDLRKSRDVARIRPEPDGTFKVTLAVGEHAIDGIQGLPPGYELVSARFGPVFITGDAKSEFRVRVKAPDAKPVRVSGRAPDVDREALRQGQVRATLSSSRYAGVIETAVKADGSFAFPSVFPGTYIVRITGPGVPADRCAPVVVSNAAVKDLSVAAAPEFEIISAMDGVNGAGSRMDVTPTVASLLTRESDEFYAAPAWLKIAANPQYPGANQLVISYQFRCRDFTFWTSEPAAVSYKILVAHANAIMERELWNGPAPAALYQTPLSTDPVSPNDFEIVNAFYGVGTSFGSVASQVRELLLEASAFNVTDALFGVSPDQTTRALIVTYLYKGRRTSLTVSKGRVLSVELLAAGATNPYDSLRHLSESPEPAWLGGID